jgi:hypothetical protein
VPIQARSLKDTREKYEHFVRGEAPYKRNQDRRLFYLERIVSSFYKMKKGYFSGIPPPPKHTYSRTPLPKKEETTEEKQKRAERLMELKERVLQDPDGPRIPICWNSLPSVTKKPTHE